MSYILDALQRREAQDNPEAAAALVIQRHKDRRMRIVVALVAIALIVNAGVLVWLATSGTAPEPTAVTSDQPTTASAAKTPAEAADEPTPVTSVPQPPTTLPAVQGQSIPRIRTPLGALPADARARFPGLAFSTHVYADDASLRAVVANGQRLTEGDDVEGVRVTQITQSGVLVEFEHYLVEIPVIADWQ